MISTQVHISDIHAVRALDVAEAFDGLHRWSETEALTLALLNGDRSSARRILDGRLRQGCSLPQVEHFLIRPALYEVGERWQRNQVTVAQEHLATAIAQSLMAQAIANVELPDLNGRRVMLACVDGNQHSIGLHMVSDALLLAGWDVQYLGASVPNDAVVAQAASFRPDVLAVSLAFPEQFLVVRELVRRLDGVLGKTRPLVWAGGAALDRQGAELREWGIDHSCLNAVSAPSLFAQRLDEGRS